MKRYSPEQRELIGALIGLARSIDETNSTFEALEALTKGLRALNGGGELSEAAEAVRSAKRKAVPDCFVCMDPCGRTADYDLGEADALAPEQTALKYALLSAVTEYAKRVKPSREDFLPALTDICGALFAVGYDFFSAEEMRETAAALEEKTRLL